MKKLALVTVVLLAVVFLQGATTTVKNDSKYVVLDVQVAAAGTAQQFLATPLAVRAFVVYAKPGNTGNLHVAPASNVDNTGDTGVELKPGASFSLSDIPQDINYNLQDWYADADSNDDGAIVIGVKQ